LTLTLGSVRGAARRPAWTKSRKAKGQSLPRPPKDQVSAAASEWLTELAASVEGAERVLLSGHPGAAVCDWAARAEVDLLVAAAHRRLVQRLALGSFAAYIAYHAPCAVLVVRP
jgi:nucleotide-binding universal stress UspA family protein